MKLKFGTVQLEVTRQTDPARRYVKQIPEYWYCPDAELVHDSKQMPADACSGPHCPVYFEWRRPRRGKGKK